jgi:hypothetical protein
LSVPNQIIKEQRDLIISEISEIDLDERLSSFKLPKIEKELLIDILHDKTLIRIEYKIDDLITSLEKVKLTYTREGEHWGSDYITNLLHSYAMLFSLLSGNYLFIILRGEYQILTHKVFYASLLAFTISDRYNAKLKQFDLFLFHQVIFYANPDKILIILADNGFPNLKLNKSQISQFINEVCNLLESTWDEDIFKNLLIPQSIKSQKELSFIFDQRLRYFVANSILLLAVTEIYPKEEDIKRITSNVLNYLKVDLIAFEYKHFEILINNKISWFSDDQLNILIEVLYKNFVRWERNIESIISSIISHKPSFKLSGPKIIRSIQKSTLQNNDIRSLILLNPVLTIELSEQLKSQLIEYFITNGITHENYVLYFEAIHFKALTILDGNLLDVYIASMGPIIQKVELSAIGDSYELNPGEANLFIEIIHQQKFDWPNSLVNFFNSEETSPLMKWALKPCTFNYNNFNVSWLIAVKHNSLVKETLKTMVISEMLDLVQAHLLTNYSYELWEIWKALSYKEHI